MESQLWNFSASSLQATILVVTDHLLELRKEMCCPFPYPSSTSSWVVNGEECLTGRRVGTISYPAYAGKRDSFTELDPTSSTWGHNAFNKVVGRRQAIASDRRQPLGIPTEYGRSIKLAPWYFKIQGQSFNIKMVSFQC